MQLDGVQIQTRVEMMHDWESLSDEVCALRSSITCFSQIREVTEVNGLAQ